MILHKNGLIVQDLRNKIDTRQDMPYCGIASYMGEPLYLLKDEISKELSKTISSLVSYLYWVDQNGTLCDLLEVIPKYDLAIKYIKHCREDFDIPIRLLFVESECPMPTWEGPLFPMTCLGYEMGSSEIDDPTMIYEIANCVHPEFERFQNRLNNNGIFDDYETISEYMSIRKKLLLEGVDIENDNTYYIMKISEIDTNDF